MIKFYYVSFLTTFKNKFFISDYSVKTLIKEGESLSRHLKGRFPPMEENQMKDHYAKIRRAAEKKCRPLCISIY